MVSRIWSVGVSPSANRCVPGEIGAVRRSRQMLPHDAQAGAAEDRFIQHRGATPRLARRSESKSARHAQPPTGTPPPRPSAVSPARIIRRRFHRPARRGRCRPPRWCRRPGPENAGRWPTSSAVPWISPRSPSVMTTGRPLCRLKHGHEAARWAPGESSSASPVHCRANRSELTR